MPLRDKYSITQWILSQDCVKIGDTISFYDDSQKKEIFAEVIAKPTTDDNQLTIKRINSQYIELINFHQIICYNVTAKASCVCGAKYTSNPSYHLRFCPLNKE